jgi:hypothetical protein
MSATSPAATNAPRRVKSQRSAMYLIEKTLLDIVAPNSRWRRHGINRDVKLDEDRDR